MVKFSKNSLESLKATDSSGPPVDVNCTGVKVKLETTSTANQARKLYAISEEAACDFFSYAGFEYLGSELVVPKRRDDIKRLDPRKEVPVVNFVRECIDFADYGPLGFLRSDTIIYSSAGQFQCQYAFVNNGGGFEARQSDSQAYMFVQRCSRPIALLETLGLEVMHYHVRHITVGHILRELNFMLQNGSLDNGQDDVGVLVADEWMKREEGAVHASGHRWLKAYNARESIGFDDADFDAKESSLRENPDYGFVWPLLERAHKREDGWIMGQYATDPYSLFEIQDPRDSVTQRQSVEMQSPGTFVTNPYLLLEIQDLEGSAAQRQPTHPQPEDKGTFVNGFGARIPSGSGQVELSTGLAESTSNPNVFYTDGLEVVFPDKSKEK